MVFGGAALNQSVSDRIQAMAVAETGHRIMLTSAYGATETTASFMVVHQYTDRLGLGLPVPGVEVKLVPYDADRFEVRVRGPNVMGGYHEDAARTAEAFDAEGYYRMGDLATLTDRDDPTQGVFFAGGWRISSSRRRAPGVWGADARNGLVGPGAARRRGGAVRRQPARLGVLAWPSPSSGSRLCWAWRPARP